MIYALVALALLYPVTVVVAGVALLRYLKARDDSERSERAALLGDQQASRSVMMSGLVEIQTQHRDEMAQLCQRIQAPEHAVIEHVQDKAPEENPWPLTEEESLEQQASLEAAVAEIERLEREGPMA